MEYTGDLVRMDIPNHFDEYGAILDLPRIPDEDIASYRLRLMDVFAHRAGHQVIPLMYGLNRELGTRYYDAGLVMRPALRADGQPVAADLSVEVRSDGIRLYSSRLSTFEEPHIVPSDTMRVTLYQEIAEPDPYITYLGTRINRKEYWLDSDNNQIVFSADFAGLTIKVTYLYTENVSLNQTMGDIVTNLNAVQLPNTGSFIASAGLAQGCLATDTGEGLSIRPRESVLGKRRSETGEWFDTVYFPWGQASLRALHDEYYINTNLSQFDTYFGTILMRLVESAKNIAHVTWSQMTFDFDRFSTGLGLSEIPILLDGRVGRWTCSDPTHTIKYRPEEAAVLNMICPIDDYALVLEGIGPSSMQSGVGGEHDLKMVVEDGGTAEAVPTTYDIVTLIDGTFTVPSTDTELAIHGEDL